MLRGLVRRSARRFSPFISRVLSAPARKFGVLTACKRAMNGTRYSADQRAIMVSHFRSLCTTASPHQMPITVQCGGVSRTRDEHADPLLVPHGYYALFETTHSLPEEQQEVLQTIRWMMQKDELNQDMMLIGPPGPLRRRIAMLFCELLNREYEYLALSRDTTEADLKQRREISDKTTRFIDQCAVRAAIHGRVLILEGLEKAERNVLPIINNLLENREMTLEDGRFLMHAARYDALLAQHSKEDLDALRLVRVHPNFRVIALALPVTRYGGNPLDPPLRSRFQSRFIAPLSPPTVLDTNDPLLSKFGEFVHATRALESAVANELPLKVLTNTTKASSNAPPDVPDEAIAAFTALRSAFPHYYHEKAPATVHRMLHRLYPYALLCRDTVVADAIRATLEKLFPEPNSSQSQRPLEGDLQWRIEAPKHTGEPGTLVVSRKGSQQAITAVPITVGAKAVGGRSISRSLSEYQQAASGDFVATPTLCQTLTEMLHDHAIGRDICLIGPRGVGKSLLAREFASLLGYSVETMSLYKDMSERDLLQRRVTRENGDTAWEPSPLLRAAISGKLAVLENIDQLPPSTLATLQRLVHDREATLFDGSRLVPKSVYDRLVAEKGNAVARDGVTTLWSVHPAFRIVATATTKSSVGIPTTPVSTVSTYNEPHSSTMAASQSATLLHPEVAQMFSFHVIGGLPASEQKQLLTRLLTTGVHGMRSFDSVNAETAAKLVLNFARALSESTHLHVSFTVRQSIRTARRVAAVLSTSSSSPAALFDTLCDVLRHSVVAEFLPPITREAVDRLITAVIASTVREQPVVGSTDRPVATAASVDHIPASPKPPHARHRHLVPDTLFFDELPHHRRLLAAIADDLSHGDHVLLLGNQGVGKNKLADRFLSLNGLPRQYVQLHRDTTVQSLTSSPAVVNGRLQWTDSPLVVAVREGHVLVVDEVDKAPTEVVVTLKALVDGDMLLADGRRLVSAHRVHAMHNTGDIVVPIHKDFRMILLANRPGWPFHGNDFFRECGDLFSVYAVDNADPESEVRLLQRYGPSVDVDTLRRIALAFADLRDIARQGGHLAYPYSLREAVAVVRHLDRYPGDGPIGALRNVFDFDALDDDVRDVVIGVLRDRVLITKAEAESGVLFGRRPAGRAAAAASAKLRLEFTPQRAPIGRGGMQLNKETMPKHGKEDPTDTPHIGGSVWAGGSGGALTAGLGGRAGPYRLHRKGHPVAQVTDDAKREVPKEVAEAARKMAREALKRRLAELEGVSEKEAAAYAGHVDAVRNEVGALRGILQSLKARREERVWLRRQAVGDLDETRLVEGIAGERTIFKRRVDGDQLSWDRQDTTNSYESRRRPVKKMINFLVDVSGSMYRFEPVDSRLTRTLQVTALVMESFAGFEDRFEYAITGHSGDTPELPLVSFGKPPQTVRDKWKVVQAMWAHAQMCSSGDFTVTAARKAVENMVSDYHHRQQRRDAESFDVDERFVIVLSDANMERYDITPAQLSKALFSHKHIVSGYFIFIASLWDEADRLRQSLPLGRSFVCLDTAQLPSALKQILSANVFL